VEKKNDELNLRISNIYSIRGVALFNSKNYDLALKEFEESTRYSPKCPQFFLSKAKCLLQLSNKPQAVEELEKCLALDPNQP
jgi:tetratricopeptide (TPR) repeat protein